DLSEAGLLIRLLEDAGLAEAEGPGETGRRRGQARDPPDDRDRDREEAVPLRRREGDRGDAPAVAQGTAHFGKRALLLREVDQAEPRDHGVERSVLDVELLAVHRPRCDVAEPCGA